jgi:hypothetical protein
LEEAVRWVVERGKMETALNNMWSIVAAIAASVAAIAAVGTGIASWWSIYSQNKRARLTLSVNLTQQFSDKWDSAHMKEMRKHAAAYILRQTTPQLTLTAQETPTITDDEDRENLIKVLNFFDHIGTVVRSSAIDEHFVWNEFFPTVQMYWLGAEPIVEKWRAETGRTIYLKDAEHLSETLITYEKKHLDRKSQQEARPSKEKVRDFLQKESKKEN